MVVKNKLVIAILVILLLSAIVFGGYRLGFFSLKPLTEQVAQTKDFWTRDETGAYAATIMYEVPDGQEQNTLRLILKDDVVTELEVGVTTKIGESLSYQQNFVRAINKRVVGRKLVDLTKIDTVSGASLTTAAFNEAIAKLRDQLRS
jgi:hypothetical protein